MDLKLANQQLEQAGLQPILNAFRLEDAIRVREAAKLKVAGSDIARSELECAQPKDANAILSSEDANLHPENSEP